MKKPGVFAELAAVRRPGCVGPRDRSLEPLRRASSTQVVHFTRLSRANRLVLDSFCTLSQTGKIVRPSVTTVYDGTSREQGRCSRLVNLVNAIGTGCETA